MISVIITSWKEPKTIGKCIRCIADNKYSGIGKTFEILQVSPDKETLEEGKKAAKKLRLSKSQYIQIKDPQRGKPFALKMARKRVKGDIVIWTDGDTFFGRNSVKELIKPFKNKKVGGVSGRPRSADKKDNIFGYWGHLLSDAADHRRTNTLKKTSEGYYISGDTFFPMSGYIMATRKTLFDIPSNVLSDDGYISYQLRNEGYEIAYAQKAECFVKYPTTLKDYYKQKVRSLGGYTQLQRMGVFKRDRQSRNFFIELGYAFYVFRYAENVKEFYWSLLLFPVRLITWIRILWERVLLRKDMPSNGWERIESTK
jgi:cellulose synthase/poly-beta-1,6-N-acetylglucosamine synthase-like glycosyltransferase